MNKFIFCLAITAIGSLQVCAQDGERIFKRFKGDISFGYAAPIGSSATGGVLFAMEPKFALMDRLSVGLRIEGAVIARFSGNYINGEPELDAAKAAGSYVATADYYFTDNYRFRPFAGAGVGVFATAQNDLNSDEQATAIKFGGLIRAGCEIKHFRFAVECNLIPATNSVSYFYDNGDPGIAAGKLKNSYIGIKAGFCFGGGPLVR